MFSAGEIPSENELTQVFKGVSSELTVSMIDIQLSITVAKNVAKTVQLMCVKCEQIVVTDGEASQVVGYPTQGQKQNVQVVNCLCKFRTGMEEDILKTIPIHETGSLAIVEALSHVDRQVSAAISPLLSSIQDAVEAILLTLHKEDFSADEAAADATTCSLYMKELQGFLSRISEDFLKEFICQEFLTTCLIPVAIKCVDQFILHASLVRPLGKAGQMTLASDCAQLELALEPLVGGNKASSEMLGKSYSTLRAFRSLLFMQAEDVSDSPVLGQALPFSTALHFLFTKSPPELKSPHDSAGWSLSRYSAWLEDHPSELERLQLLQGTLESYVAGTRARQEKSYAHPYPIMLKILEKGLIKQGN